MAAASDPRVDQLVERLQRLEKRNLVQRRWIMGTVGLIVTFASSTLYAQVGWAPPGFHIFAPDTPALASEVNANFQWLVTNPGAAFLTTGTCPAGYATHQGGEYLRLGTPSLTPVARTLVTPAHRHTDLTGFVVANAGLHAHNYNDYYWHDSGNTGEFGTPDGDGSGQRLEAGRTTTNAGDHAHGVSGRVGPAAGVNGDANVTITGELQHLTLRLCVKL